MKLYCATSNRGKLREFHLAVANLPDVEIEPLENLARLPACEEVGQTFEENAILKAKYYGRYAPGLLFSEDSGIEVEALGGAPGVYSARFAGEGATDESNNLLLLEKLRGVENRAARYVSVIALVQGGDVKGVFRGEVEGQILEAPRGEGGFGYDPLFYHPPFGCTFAEVTAERKFTVSHRGRAVGRMEQFLRQHWENLISRPLSG
ncbi:MAG: RdgB/HAM1 family non-canonical purine NTP pyrophosphatase [Bryobacteraceae bacterium]